MNEEGDLVVIDEDGEKHEHCVKLMIASDEQPAEITDHIMILGGKETLGGK